MSEQGQTPPREPSGNEPQAAQPAPDQATTPLPATPADEAPAAPAATRATTAAEGPAAPAAAEAPAASAADAPAGPPAPPAATPAPPAAVPASRGRARRFAGHRATQLVAVGLLGLVLGGGIVGAVAANRFDDRGGPGHVRMYERGPDRGPAHGDQRGPFGDRGNRFER
jgi:hypothetical protein